MRDRTVEVQNPDSELLDVEALDWVSKPGLKGVVAYIPTERLPDFVDGEELRTNCKFVLEDVQNNKAKTFAKVTDRTHLYSARYQCCHGPSDGRKQAQLRNPGQIRSKIAMGEGNKMGCQAHFRAATYVKEPHVCEILMYQAEHVNKDGIVCEHTRAPRLSEDCIRDAYQGLLVQKSDAVILADNKRKVAIKVQLQHNLASPEEAIDLMYSDSRHLHRDFLLNKKDLSNLRQRLDCRTWKLDKNPAQCTRLLQQKEHENVILYQEQSHPGVAFILCLMTDWQRKMLIEHGDGSVLLMDATMGTNKQKFPLFTLLVMDQHENCIPVVWTIQSSQAGDDITLWLKAVVASVRQHKADWMPSCFLVDDCDAELNAIRSVFGRAVPAYLCVWHIQRNWLDHLIRKVKDKAARTRIFDALHLILFFKGEAHASRDEIQAQLDEMMRAFFQQFSSHSDFLNYFKRTWLPKLERWAVGLRKAMRKNQNTTSGAEGYHGGMKIKLAASKPQLRSRPVPWLVYMLLYAVLPFYIEAARQKQAGLIRNSKAEQRAVAAVFKAAEIPDGNVELLGPDSGLALVTSTRDPEVRYTVSTARAPGATLGACDCLDGIAGNFCKHRAKVLLMHNMGELQIVHTFGTRFGRGEDSTPLAGLNTNQAASQLSQRAASQLSQQEPRLAVPRCSNLQALTDRFESLLAAQKEAGRDPNSVVYKQLQHALDSSAHCIEAAEAKGILVEGTACSFQGRDDGQGFSLKRLKPYFEVGSGKGNRTKKQKTGEENRLPAAQFCSEPTARQPKTVRGHLLQANERAKQREGIQQRRAFAESH